MFLHMFERLGCRIVFIYPVVRGVSVHQLWPAVSLIPDHRRTLPEIWATHPDGNSCCRAGNPRIEEVALRADAANLVQSGISQSRYKLKFVTLQFKRRICKILRFTTWLSREDVETVCNYFTLFDKSQVQTTHKLLLTCVTRKKNEYHKSTYYRVQRLSLNLLFGALRPSL